jgi:outer membrane protein assembly factor BamE (lipoprotein component of BamABCDE complex)
VIPYHRHIHKVPDEKTLASIKEGTTSKEDILMMLGEPDRVTNNERLFSYWWQEESGAVGVIAVPGAGGRIGDDSTKHTYSLYIEFDENNIVKWFEIKKKHQFDELDKEGSDWIPK